MPSELLTPGTAEATSAETALTDGQTASVFLTSDSSGVPSNGAAYVQIQRSGGGWTDLHILQGPSKMTADVRGPVTFRVMRRAPSVFGSPVGAEVVISSAAGGGGGGSVTVSNFPATQPVSAVALPLPTGAATSALQTTGNTSLGTLATNSPALSAGAVPVETIKQALVARQLAVAASSGASANQALTTTCRRISIYARGADVRYAIGSAAQTASATTHFIAAGERLDLAVPATPNIAVLGATLTTGTLEVTELS